MERKDKDLSTSCNRCINEKNNYLLSLLKQKMPQAP